MDIYHLIQQCQSISQHLAQHTCTLKHANTLATIKAAAQDQARFSVVVLGRMSVGKSSLINALVAQDLAPIGATATTATINKFVYDNGDRQGLCQVHRKDDTTHFVNVRELDQWVGTAIQAEQLAHVDLYCNSALLLDGDIIDTPGVDSVILNHTDATLGYLTGKRVDALLIVLNHEMKQTDSRFINAMLQTANVPYITAENTTVVIQQWEELFIAKGLAGVQERQAKIKAELEANLGTAVPVYCCSPMAERIARTLPAEAQVWSDLVALAQSGNAYLMDDPEDFIEEPLDTTYAHINREHILKAVPWQMIRFSFALIEQLHIQSGLALHAELKRLARIDLLRQTIKHNCIDKKNWLQNIADAEQFHRTLKCAIESIRQQLNDAIATEDNTLHAILTSNPNPANTAPLTQYLKNRQDTLACEKEALQNSWARCERLVLKLSATKRLLQNDLQCLQYLETDEYPATAQEKKQLRNLFGAQGLSVAKRLSLESADLNTAPLCDIITKLRHTYSQPSARGIKRQVHQHANFVLESALDALAL